MRRALDSAVAAALALPASAAATLVYTTQPSRKPPVLWSAFNDGSGAIRLGSNYSGAKLSPDGTSVLAVRQSRKGVNQLFLLPTAGGGATALPRAVGAVRVVAELAAHRRRDRQAARADRRRHRRRVRPRRRRGHRPERGVVWA